MECLDDETRPVEVWPVHANVQGYVRDELGRFLRTFWRDLLCSQPNQIELIVEKNMLSGIVEPIAKEFTVPLTIGRGYCSLPPRVKMAERFKASGKEKLILLLVSDHDPDGDEISASFARSLRDDFDVDDIHPVRVALTRAQVKKYRLPPRMTAKKSSVHYSKFIAQHGTDTVFEVEAINPPVLQAIVRQAIESVLDIDAYNVERQAEQQDAKFLEGRRVQVARLMAEIDAANDGGNT